MPNRSVLQAQTERQVDGKQDSTRLNGVEQWHVQEEGEGEERMIKPDRDSKLYRVISLTNGLTVCLVSDPRCSPLAEDEHLDDNINDIDSADDDSEDNDDDDVDEDYESDGKDCEDGESGDSEMEEGNKRRHHPSQRQSAAALCVAVGSFSDPPEVQGLAHLLEHMVFMGNSRYPSENGFDAFLKRHGGTDNAFTDTHMTTFILGCPRRSFARALHRWAQFFVSPLLREDAVSRETEAVDSEFQEALLSDSTRWEALVSSLARQGHPMGNFSWGNRKSLQCHGLHKSLREFWENHYSANHMTLTVQSQDSLDHLEHLVTKIFADIPQNNRPKPDFSHVGPAFEPSVLHRLYRVVPVKTSHTLTLTWALPCLLQHYRVKPLTYLSWLIGHEGKGGIMATLRKRCWATRLLCGSSLGFEHNPTGALLSVAITLTDTGLSHWPQVVHLVFQYLKMLQKAGPNQRVFEEVSAIERNEFCWGEEHEALVHCEDICQALHMYPPHLALAGDYLLLQYDPMVIVSVLDQLTPQQANLMLASQDAGHKVCCTLRENWFGTAYIDEDIPAEWANLWASDFALEPILHLPEPNPYIATDFSLLPAQPNPPAYPVLIWPSPSSCLSPSPGRLWYKLAHEFPQPYAYLQFYLISPIVGESALSAALMDVLVAVADYNMATVVYEGEAARLEVVLEAKEHGLIISLHGLSHRLGALFYIVVEALVQLQFSSIVVETMVEQTVRNYRNKILRTSRLARDTRLCALQPGRWGLVDKWKALTEAMTGWAEKREKQELGKCEQPEGDGEITLHNDMIEFWQNLRSCMFVEGLVQGNVTEKEAVSFMDHMITCLECRPPQSPPSTSWPVLSLPQQVLTLRLASPVPDDPNSIITRYFQAGPGTVQQQQLNEVLVALMEEPCFDFLRTKETLGYEACPCNRDTAGILGMSITVCTQANKYSSATVEAKITEFLDKFAGILHTLSDEDFQTQISSLVQLKQMPDVHLGEEFERNWNEIGTQRYLFDRLKQEVQILQTLKKDDVVSWFNSLCTSGGQNKTLSIHVLGSGSAEPDTKNLHSKEVTTITTTDHVSAPIPLSFLPSYLSAVTAICDLPEFHASHICYPPHKILA